MDKAMTDAEYIAYLNGMEEDILLPTKKERRRAHWLRVWSGTWKVLSIVFILLGIYDLGSAWWHYMAGDITTMQLTSGLVGIWIIYFYNKNFNWFAARR